MITSLFIRSERPLEVSVGCLFGTGIVVDVRRTDCRLGWHALAECVPPDHEAVLLYTRNGETRVGMIGYEGLFVDEETGACIENDDTVTHWCWIPERPMVDDAGEAITW
ncbi:MULTISPECIES: hypothetical protein [Serratia]|uniref:hypothetical protein n=1 Tax=Serratia TaxID=613 RepID=UPI000660C3DC|nr:hypothetical protein [Serratia sp. 506_PEND]